MKRARFAAAVLVVGVGSLLGTGCGRPAAEAGGAGGAPDLAAASVGPASAVEARRAELLQRIRAADPKKQTIERALINERNELGLVLNRGVELDEVPQLMRAMLAQLDTTFPGQDHLVVAYTPTEPPRVIGRARLDASSRDMIYTPASPES